MVLAMAVAVAASCTPYEESGLPGSAAWIARGKIMTVREQPPSFGYQRLRAHIAKHEEIGLFLDERGWPDFLAESENRGRRYLIFYYTASKSAFACREGGQFGKTMEFSGPYPITEKEMRMLGQLRGR